jgi:hypothetical protein
MITKRCLQLGTLFCLVAAMATAGSIPTLHNTGSQLNGNPLAYGQQDSFWTVGNQSAYVTDLSGGNFPGPYWLNESTADSSAWISPQANYTTGSRSDAQNTSYDFQTTFSLPGPSASVTFQYVADNQLWDVLLNNVSVFGPSVYGDGGAGLMNWTGSATINSGFVAGQNTLDFIVKNGSGDNGNPTGLRVGFTDATATPEPASFAITGAALIGLAVLVRKLRR